MAVDTNRFHQSARHDNGRDGGLTGMVGCGPFKRTRGVDQRWKIGRYRLGICSTMSAIAVP